MLQLRDLASWRSVRITLGVIAVVALIVGAVAIGSPPPGQAVETSPLDVAGVATLAAIAAAILGVARYGGEGYFAALWMFAPLAPVLAAAVSVPTYLLLPDLATDAPNSGIEAVYVGLSTALLGWFLSGFPGAPLASRDRAQMRVYNDLVQRYGVLAARAQAERDRCGGRPSKALVEAESCLAYVDAELHGASCAGPALRWALSSGYTGLTRQLHRAEEALIAVEPVPELVGDMLHDDLSLEDSGLRNRFALRRVIRDALPVISPGAAEALLRPVPALPPVAAAATAASAEAARAEPRPLSPEEAREALREVRFAINDYRDDIVDSFARGRNRLIWTYLAVSISTYVLLGLGLIAGIPRLTLVSVSVLYLVASLIGLFNRLRIEASYTPRVDDYGLYQARLLTGPLLSGLAGVAGVYLIAQAPAFLGPLTASPPEPTAPALVEVPAPKPLAEIYDLTRNELGILVAAVFGLAPGLLTTRLQAQVDRLERDLARSEPATSASASGLGSADTSEDDQG